MSPPRAQRRRAAVSCVECRRRKVRCSRTQPCTRCVSARKGRTCAYTDADGNVVLRSASVGTDNTTGRSIPLSASSSVERTVVFSSLSQDHHHSGHPVDNRGAQEIEIQNGAVHQTSGAAYTTRQRHPVNGHTDCHIGRGPNIQWCASIGVDHFREPIEGKLVSVPGCLARGENERIRY